MTSAFQSVAAALHRFRPPGSGNEKILPAEIQLLYHSEPVFATPQVRARAVIRAETEFAARGLGRLAPRGEGIDVLGPAPAPFALLRGRYRFRFLVRAVRDVRLQPILAAWLAGAPQNRRVRLQVDIDPQSFL